MHLPRTDRLGYLFRSLVRILMLPKSHDLPTSRSESFVGVGITPAIRFNLVSPEIDIALGPCPMFWATMPEATVDEHGNAGACKGHVCTAPRPVEDGLVDAVPQAHGVQPAAYF
jgi:hypothetical protein